MTSADELRRVLRAAADYRSADENVREKSARPFATSSPRRASSGSERVHTRLGEGPLARREHREGSAADSGRRPAVQLE